MDEDMGGNDEVLKVASETLTWLRELTPANNTFRDEINFNRIRVLKACKRIGEHLNTFYGQNVRLGKRIYELLPAAAELLPSIGNYSHIQGVLIDLLAMHATRERFEMAYREQWREVKRTELLLLDSELEKILLMGSQRGLLVRCVEKEGFMGITFEGRRDALCTFRE